MLSNSYLILSPAEPTDIAAAVATQRQTIPMAWALSVAAPSTQLVHDKGHYYFATRVGDALGSLDRGLAAWNYNSYFRDTLAPISVFRAWLANYQSDTWLYVNITELIARSPSPERDIAELTKLSDKVNVAYEEIEQKNFTNFLLELRKLSYPLITVPITGDRKRDVEILSYEIRDTQSIEDEMALQMVGVDRDTSMLQRATEAIKLRKSADQPSATAEPRRALTLFTSNLDEARTLLVDELGCTVLKEGPGRLLLNAHGREFVIVKIADE